MYPSLKLRPSASLVVILCLVLTAASIEISAATGAHGGGGGGRVPWYDRIRRIVVLMEENRSFDHIMGWNPRTKHGLTGNEFNYLNCSNHSLGKVHVHANAKYINDCDPNHGYPATSYKIFGPAASEKSNWSQPSMSGFVDWERNVDGWNDPKYQYCDVMSGFLPDQLPVWTSLVENFVAFDKFFCSVPGPTWPNRLFFLAATSKGLTETIPWYKGTFGRLFPVRTIFDQIRDSGVGTWKYYYADTPWELFIQSLANSPEHVENMDGFLQDCRDGTLPNFAFINPRSGINMTTGHGSNDMHPDHDVALSEKLYKDVYEALRASPQWNETLLIVTFDEHGGFYDHIAPPQPIPAPEDYGFASYPDTFAFNRSGIRIPTVMISPWLPKGWMESDPPSGSKPFPNSAYELTSVMATVRKLLPFMNESGPLTKRDEWAATFEHLFDVLDEPRTDCPVHLPEPPAPATYGDGRHHSSAPTSHHAVPEHERPVNSLQTYIMEVNAHLAGVDYPHQITKQAHVSEWLQRHFHVHRERAFSWKRSKFHHPESTVNFTLGNVPYILDTAISCYWTMHANASVVPFVTFSLDLYNATYCLDRGVELRPGEPIGLSACWPSPDPATNRDTAQHWVWHPDFTLRPYDDPSLCVQANWIRFGETTLRLEQCHPGPVPSVWQTFAYMGNAPGMGGPGALEEGTHHIYNGDDLSLFCAIPLRSASSTRRFIDSIPS